MHCYGILWSYPGYIETRNGPPNAASGMMGSIHANICPIYLIFGLAVAANPQPRKYVGHIVSPYSGYRTFISSLSSPSVSDLGFYKRVTSSLREGADRDQNFGCGLEKFPDFAYIHNHGLRP